MTRQRPGAFSRLYVFLCSPFTDHELSLIVNALGVRAFLRECPSLISVLVFDVISAVKLAHPITRHLALSIEDVYGLRREWPFTDPLLIAFPNCTSYLVLGHPAYFKLCLYECIGILSTSLQFKIHYSSVQTTIVKFYMPNFKYASAKKEPVA